MAAHLRLYHGPQDSTAEVSSPETITLSVSEILPLLADAYKTRRTWLQDFEEDEITISTDLFEVLASYEFFRRPSA